MPGRARFSGKLDWAGYLLGFGLGGFFDGILLHQILQWHHLLSLVSGVGDVRSQILFDGLFHALMYLIAAAGLVLLWRARRALGAAGAGRRLPAGVLIGFGTWHVLDAVLSHWLLGIHRIRLDSPNPMAWDIFWLGLFGALPIAAGLLVRRGGDGGSAGRAAALGLGILVLGAGAVAGRPPTDARTAFALFGPGTSDGEALNAIRAADGRLLWQSRGVWAVNWPDRARPAPLYRSGAIFVSSSMLGAGCLAWTSL